MSFNLFFFHGNLSDCATVKAVPRKGAVEQIGLVQTARGRRGAILKLTCPNLDSMMETQSGLEFSNLDEEGNEILQDMPNHVMVNPDIYDVAEGEKTIQAAKLAGDIIKWLKVDESDDEDVAELKRNEAGAAETVLAFLWAVANEKTVPLELGDIPEDSTLNQLIRSFREKAEERSATSVSIDGSPDRVGTQVGAEALALSSLGEPGRGKDEKGKQGFPTQDHGP